MNYGNREIGIYINFGDHPPPHVHVAKADAIMKIDLSTNEVVEIAGTISFLETEANAGVIDLTVAGTMSPFGSVAFLFDTATDRYLFDRTGPTPATAPSVVPRKPVWEKIRMWV